MNGDLVGIKKSKWCKGFSAAWHISSILLIQGISACSCQDGTMSIVIFLTQTNSESSLQSYGTCREQVGWQPHWMQAASQNLTVHQRVWEVFKWKECLLQMALKGLIISALQSVERLLLLWTSPAPPIKSQFWMMSSHTTKNVSGLYGVSSIQPMTTSKKSLILMPWNKNPHMCRHAPWTWAIPAKRKV